MGKEPYRNIAVCYDEYTQFGWRTTEEFAKLFNEGRVTWFSDGSKTIVYVDNKKLNERKPIIPDL